MSNFAIFEDAAAVYEEILDREDMDYEKCAAGEGEDLCGSSWCHSGGCIVDKLARVRTAQSEPV